MLDEQEYEEIYQLYSAGMESVQCIRRETDAQLKDVPFDQRFVPLLSR